MKLRCQKLTIYVLNVLKILLCFSGSRNVRRKSVLSPRMLRPPGDDIENSPANSITSVNSIASLLREKLQVNNRIYYIIAF